MNRTDVLLQPLEEGGEDFPPHQPAEDPDPSKVRATL